MAGEFFQQRDPNTPWWYETPSLVSQTTHLTGFASSTESNPLDITPSVSSGYFEEDDGSNISEGSYGGPMSGGLGGGGNGSGGGVAAMPYSSAPVLAAPYQRTESNWSTASTIKDGQGNTSSAVNDVREVRYLLFMCVLYFYHVFLVLVNTKNVAHSQGSIKVFLKISFGSSTQWVAKKELPGASCICLYANESHLIFSLFVLLFS